MRRITERAELVALAAELGVRHDWHEPDERGVTAYIEGTGLDFDNAGHWPMRHGYGYDRNELGGPRRSELCVWLARKVWDDAHHCYRRGEDIAVVNLATLFAWASDDRAEALAAEVERLKAENARLAGTTVRDVHTAHCCSTHGCKYEYNWAHTKEECTVTSGRAPQEYPCEQCGEDREEERRVLTRLLKNLAS